jgi:CDP-paratose synthetase
LTKAKRMKIILTGATGFIGSHLLLELIKHHEVFCLVRENKFDPHQYPKVENLKFFNDLNKFDNQESNQFDLIIHLATHFVANHRTEDIPNLIEANLLLGLRLLEFAKIHTVGFINISSFAQNIDGYFGMPQNLYSATKKSFNNLIKYYCWDFDITAIDIELFDSYGRNDFRNKFYMQAINAFVNNQDFKMSEGKQEICIIHVKDIVKAILQASNLIVFSNGYNEYTLFEKKNTHKLKDLAQEIKEIIGSKSKINSNYYEYRKNEIFTLRSSRSSLPGWHSEINLNNGIKTIINDSRS